MKTIEELKNQIICGDCLIKLKELEDNSIDSIVTDPPYELGFMGKSWDNTGIANNKDMWAECLRVLKPGGHLLAFSGTRTYHRMACAIEDAGFEVRDMIEWVYGSGFPKSLNIGKAVDKLQGKEPIIVGKRTDGRYGSKFQDGNNQFVNAENNQRKEVDSKIGLITKPATPEGEQWEGWGTALKPSHEPICMARKPLDRWWKIKDDGKKVMGRVITVAENCLKWGTGGINIDESRVEGKTEIHSNGKRSMYGGNSLLESKTHNDKTEVKDYGRFPANLIHDNSEEVRECFPDSGGGKAKHNSEITRKGIAQDGSSFNAETCGFDVNKCQGMANFGDSGNASRFFKSILYYPKASKSERNKGCEGLEEKPKVFNGQSDKPSTDIKDVEKRFTTLPKANNHPTVKPIALMEYLIKMVTPKGGIVLDPFAGSGSTLVAAKQNGYQYIGIELTEEYIPIIEARLNSPTQDKLL